MSLHLTRAGACTLIVDGGRPHSRNLGVSVSGAADRAAWKIANGLVGNPPETPALEIALAGPTLRTDEPVSFALFGCDFRIERDGKPIPPGAVFHLLPGQTLSIGSATIGMRAYLAVAGGIRSPVVLDSQSSFAPLTSKTIVEVESVAAPLRSLSRCGFRELIDISPGSPIRVVPGPQADWFDVNEFLSHRYTVSPSSNRMGIRLEGEPIARPKREMVSEPVCPGAIQVTNEGLPIVLGVDGQTVGGYPKIAHVIDADLDWLAQLRPRDEVRFEMVSFQEADAIDEKYRKSLREWLMRLRVAEGIRISG